MKVGECRRRPPVSLSDLEPGRASARGLAVNEALKSEYYRAPMRLRQPIASSRDLRLACTNTLAQTLFLGTSALVQRL
eukprot:1986622-Alexandrium_andersonii.AAC.1